jgi:hypothetical protein
MVVGWTMANRPEVVYIVKYYRDKGVPLAFDLNVQIRSVLSQPFGCKTVLSR